MNQRSKKAQENMKDFNAWKAKKKKKLEMTAKGSKYTNALMEGPSRG